MHPVTARRLIDKLSPSGSVLLDPFCGSGTVLVEGRIAGRHVIGVDANPLAIELAWLKTRPWPERERLQIFESSRSAVSFAEARRQRRSGATHRYGQEDVALFDPHVLLELDGLRAGIARISAATTRRALYLVLSSILTKVSRRPGDTSPGQAARRLASGFAIRVFGQKADELVRRLAALASLLPTTGRDRVVLRTGDARKLDGVDDASVDLIVSSPPYPGNYDYLSHHEARLRWLGLDREELARIELGARRHLEPLPEGAASARWSHELGDALRAMSRVLSPDGRIALVLGDSVIRRRPVYADELVRKLAPERGLVLTTVGSQARPHFHGASARAFDRSPRKEHVLICRHLAFRRGAAGEPAPLPKVR
jgi:SAM-dependent methyltransferase